MHSLDHRERTPLHLSTLNGHIVSVTTLLLRFPDPLLSDDSGKSPMNVAIDFGRSRLEIGEMLLEYFVKIWAPTVRRIITTEVLRGQAREAAQAGVSASVRATMDVCPLNVLEADVLFLIADFLTTTDTGTPKAALDNIHHIRTLRGVGPARALRSTDPRARSLPFLLRQSEASAPSGSLTSEETLEEKK